MVHGQLKSVSSQGEFQIMGVDVFQVFLPYDPPGNFFHLLRYPGNSQVQRHSQHPHGKMGLFRMDSWKLHREHFYAPKCWSLAKNKDRAASPKFSFAYTRVFATLFRGRNTSLGTNLIYGTNWVRVCRSVLFSFTCQASKSGFLLTEDPPVRGHSSFTWIFGQQCSYTAPLQPLV